jgi:hypothetical protein
MYGQRRNEEGADDEGVDEDADRDDEAELERDDQRERGEHRERRREDDSGTGDDTAGDGQGGQAARWYAAVASALRASATPGRRW